MRLILVYIFIYWLNYYSNWNLKFHRLKKLFDPKNNHKLLTVPRHYSGIYSSTGVHIPTFSFLLQEVPFYSH